MLRALSPCVASLLLGALACGSEPPRPERPHIVFVLLDTVRQKHLGVYGYGRDTTPTIDALAEDGLVFENAVAQSSFTLPSMGSLLTSRYPSELFEELSSATRPAFTPRTMTQALAAAGYATVSVGTNPYNRPFFRLMEGFDRSFYESSANADRVIDIAIEALDELRSNRGAEPERPVFLYLHFMDLHHPLNVPPPYDEWFPSPDDVAPDQSVRARLRFGNPDQLDSDAFRVYRDRKLALYDGGLRFIDAELRRLLDHLEEIGMREDSVFVISGDHGQEFWDHAALGRALGLERANQPGTYGSGHGHTLFPELVQVPLVLSGRGIPSGRVETQVRNLDIAPTLLALAHADGSQLEMRGTDLLAAWADRSLAPLPAFTETRSTSARQWSIVADGFQLLRLDDRDVLFDLRSGELRDVTAEQPDRLERMRAALDRELDSIDVPTADAADAGRGIVEELRALGYVD